LPPSAFDTSLCLSAFVAKKDAVARARNPTRNQMRMYASFGEERDAMLRGPSRVCYAVAGFPR
jgi:hypothetical protein